MTKGQNQVKEFMEFFGQDCPVEPTRIDEETAILRAKLILEEALETIVKGLGLRILLTENDGGVDISNNDLNYWMTNEKAIQFQKEKEVDLIELADGLADLAYVGEFGTAVAAGIDLEPVQDEIHSSNMSKCWTENDLDEAKRLYPTAKIENYGGGLYRLLREDGKVIKSPSYRPADIVPILEKQIKG